MNIIEVIRRGYRNIKNRMQRRILSAYTNLLNSDFGWINFLSGIMISSSIGTLDSYCTSDSGSIFELLSAVTTGISSWYLFLLYQKLSAIIQSIYEATEHSGVNTNLHEDFTVLKKRKAKNEIAKKSHSLILYTIMAFSAGFIGLLFLLLCYVDKNPDKFSFLKNANFTVYQCIRTTGGAIS